MAKNNSPILESKNKIIGTVLTLVLVLLGGYTAFTVLSPLSESEKQRLADEILGKRIKYDQEIIERVEKRRDYGRDIETGFVDLKQKRFELTGTPENFFDANRLKKCYSDPRPLDC